MYVHPCIDVDAKTIYIRPTLKKFFLIDLRIFSLKVEGRRREKIKIKN